MKKFLVGSVMMGILMSSVGAHADTYQCDPKEIKHTDKTITDFLISIRGPDSATYRMTLADKNDDTVTPMNDPTLFPDGSDGFVDQTGDVQIFFGNSDACGADITVKIKSLKSSTTLNCKKSSC